MTLDDLSIDHGRMISGHVIVVQCIYTTYINQSKRFLEKSSKNQSRVLFCWSYEENDYKINGKKKIEIIEK